jgi:mycothione reductase
VQEYALIVLGSGSAVSVLDGWLRAHPGARGAVIDKDAPGGICLTRGCIPWKLLTAAADVSRTVERAGEFGVNVERWYVDFGKVMERLHRRIDPDIESIRSGLSHAPELDYFPTTAEFVAPHTLRTATGETLRSERIVLGLGSEPDVPAIPGLAEAGYLTSDTVFGLRELPGRLAILGGGYIAAELAHFFSAMGSEVTIVGRNPRFLPHEDPEVSEAVARGLGRRARLLLGRSPARVAGGAPRGKRLYLPAAEGASAEELVVDELLVATGRRSTAHLLHPERSGVQVDPAGWLRVNEYLETGVAGIGAIGDATGARYQFKHRANHDAEVLYRNLVEGRRVPVDYHAVPHAVFTDPEVAAVGLTQPEAVDRYGRERVLVGRYDYRDTAKGQAIGAEEGFVKVLALTEPLEVLGAHIVGPQASVLIQEVVNLLYAPGRSARPAIEAMHIHPALTEVVQRAFRSLRPVGHDPRPSAG